MQNSVKMSIDMQHIEVTIVSPPPYHDENTGSADTAAGVTPEFVNIETSSHNDHTYSLKVENDGDNVEGNVYEYYVVTDDIQQEIPVEVEYVEQEEPAAVNTIIERDNILSTSEAVPKTEDASTDSKKNFLCHVCPNSYTTKRKLQKHMLTHSKIIYQCYLCPKQYTNKRQGTIHIYKHNTLKEYKCRKCDNIMKVPYHLWKNAEKRCCDQCKQASIERRQSAKKPMVCTVCGKEFGREYLLNSHLLKHSTDRPFICDLCKKSFKHKSALVRHSGMHSGGKPYTCQYCLRKFTHFRLMKPHLRCHTGDEPYICQVCDERFANSDGLHLHIGSHKRGNDLVCVLCDKTFPVEMHLKYHLHTHAGEKFYSCGLCDKLMSFTHAVVTHYRTSHPDASLACKETRAKITLKVWNGRKGIPLDRVPGARPPNATPNVIVEPVEYGYNVNAFNYANLGINSGTIFNSF